MSITYLEAVPNKSGVMIKTLDLNITPGGLMAILRDVFANGGKGRVRLTIDDTTMLAAMHLATGLPETPYQQLIELLEAHGDMLVKAL